MKNVVRLWNGWQRVEFGDVGRWGAGGWVGGWKKKGVRISSNLRVLKKFIELFGVEKGKVTLKLIAFERGSRILQNYSTCRKIKRRNLREKGKICLSISAGGTEKRVVTCFLWPNKGIFFSPFTFFLSTRSWFELVPGSGPIKLDEKNGKRLFCGAYINELIASDILIRNEDQ